MTLRKIAQIGHPILRQTARKVSMEMLATDETQAFIEDLVQTMRDANGAGLAATQVYEPIAICAIEVGNNPRYPHKPKIPLTVLVNPEFEPLSDETFDNFEGCLSVPDLRGRVKRFGHIRVTASTPSGEPFEQECFGFTAGTMQHEIDHLFGKLFVDHVTDTSTLTTWAHFEAHHKAEFMETVQHVLQRYHQ